MNRMKLNYRSTLLRNLLSNDRISQDKEVALRTYFILLVIFGCHELHMKFALLNPFLMVIFSEDQMMFTWNLVDPSLFQWRIFFYRHIFQVLRILNF